MNYDEDLLVELIAGGDVSQTEIAERVGVSRRTVWRIANGHSRPDLQRKIAATVEGYRQAAIRLAARFMKPLLEKQIEVALEDSGETSRRCREFLLKTFMLALPGQAVKAAAKREPNSDKIAVEVNLTDLSPDLKEQVVKELGGPTEEKHSTTPLPEDAEAEEATDLVSSSPLPLPLTSPVASSQLPVATPTDKSVGDDEGKKGKKKVGAPFGNKVDGPFGKKVYRHSVELVRQELAELEAEKGKPPRRRVKRSANRYHYP